MQPRGYLIPVKVELVLEAGLASGLPLAADRHDHNQASSLGPETIAKGRSLLLRSVKTCDCEEGTHYDATTRQRDLYGRKFSIMLNADTYKFVTSIL